MYFRQKRERTCSNKHMHPNPLGQDTWSYNNYSGETVSFMPLPPKALCFWFVHPVGRPSVRPWSIPVTVITCEPLNGFVTNIVKKKKKVYSIMLQRWIGSILGSKGRRSCDLQLKVAGFICGDNLWTTEGILTKLGRMMEWKYKD